MQQFDSATSPTQATLAFNAHHQRLSPAANDAAAFNTAVAKYEAAARAMPNPPLWSEQPERAGVLLQPRLAVLRRHDPLCRWRSSWRIFGWLFRYKPLNWAAFTLILLTFVLHTVALVARIYISGRPPVTNLYSSAIFIGWACVLFGLVIEAIFRLGLGNIVAAVVGLCDAAHRLFPVARTATRSPCCRPCSTRSSGWRRTSSASRSATRRRIVAGLFGVLYVLVGLCDAAARRRRSRKELGRMIYGIALLRDPLQLLRHGARRPVGRRFLGPLLGLGPEGKRRPDHRALERARPARPLGQDDRRPRPGASSPSAATSSPAGPGSASTSSASACTPTASPNGVRHRPRPVRRLAAHPHRPRLPAQVAVVERASRRGPSRHAGGLISQRPGSHGLRGNPVRTLCVALRTQSV